MSYIHAYTHMIKSDLELIGSQTCKISHLIIGGTLSSWWCTKTWQIDDGPQSVCVAADTLLVEAWG